MVTVVATQPRSWSSCTRHDRPFPAWTSLVLPLWLRFLSSIVYDFPLRSFPLHSKTNRLSTESWTAVMERRGKTWLLTFRAFIFRHSFCWRRANAFILSSHFSPRRSIAFSWQPIVLFCADSVNLCLLILPLPRVINFKLLLQPHQKYYITQ